MATKIKADLIFQYNMLPVYLDDNTKIDNILSNFDYTDFTGVLNAKNSNEFDIEMVSISIGLSDSMITIFSEVFPSVTQIVKFWNISDFTAPEQVIINDFIALL